MHQVIDEMSNQSIENPRFLAQNQDLNLREQIKTPDRRGNIENNSSGLNSIEKDFGSGGVGLGNSAGSFRNQILMSADKKISELNEKLFQSKSG